MNPIVMVEFVISLKSGLESISIDRKNGERKTFYNHLQPMARILRKNLKKFKHENFNELTDQFIYAQYWR